MRYATGSLLAKYQGVDDLTLACKQAYIPTYICRCERTSICTDAHAWILGFQVQIPVFLVEESCNLV